MGIKLLEITVKCKACGKDLVLDKEHHRVVRDETTTGLPVAFREKQEAKHYDAFDCEYCGCQTIIGERKREVYEVKFEEVEVEEDMVEDEDPKDGANSSPDGYDYDYDREDILKKIAEAGEEYKVE